MDPQERYNVLPSAGMYELPESMIDFGGQRMGDSEEIEAVELQSPWERNSRSSLQWVKFFGTR